jgi:hypothetical protein
LLEKTREYDEVNNLLQEKQKEFTEQIEREKEKLQLLLSEKQVSY